MSRSGRGGSSWEVDDGFTTYIHIHVSVPVSVSLCTSLGCTHVCVCVCVCASLGCTRVCVCVCVCVSLCLSSMSFCSICTSFHTHFSMCANERVSESKRGRETEIIRNGIRGESRYLCHVCACRGGGRFIRSKSDE